MLGTMGPGRDSASRPRNREQPQRGAVHSFAEFDALFNLLVVSEVCSSAGRWYSRFRVWRVAVSGLLLSSAAPRRKKDLFAGIAVPIGSSISVAVASMSPMRFRLGAHSSSSLCLLSCPGASTSNDEFDPNDSGAPAVDVLYNVFTRSISFGCLQDNPPMVFNTVYTRQYHVRAVLLRISNASPIGLSSVHAFFPSGTVTSATSIFRQLGRVLPRRLTAACTGTSSSSTHSPLLLLRLVKVSLNPKTRCPSPSFVPERVDHVQALLFPSFGQILGQGVKQTAPVALCISGSTWSASSPLVFREHLGESLPQHHAGGSPSLRPWSSDTHARQQVWRSLRWRRRVQLLGS